MPVRCSDDYGRLWGGYWDLEQWWKWVVGVKELQGHQEDVGIVHGAVPHPFHGNVALLGEVVLGESGGEGPDKSGLAFDKGGEGGEMWEYLFEEWGIMVEE